MGQMIASDAEWRGPGQRHNRPQEQAEEGLEQSKPAFDVATKAGDAFKSTAKKLGECKCKAVSPMSEPPLDERFKGLEALGDDAFEWVQRYVGLSRWERPSLQNDAHGRQKTFRSWPCKTHSG